jgi:Uma2 family endonuclease
MTPEETAEKQLSEYVIERGKPMPSLNQGSIQTNISGALWSKYRHEYSIITELSLELPGTRLMVFDVCVYSKKVYNGFQDQKRVTEPALIAIEILSYSQGSDELAEKFEAYFVAGVQSCWFVQPVVDTIFIITPDKEVSVFHKGTLTDRATGITLDLNDVFA